MRPGAKRKIVAYKFATLLARTTFVVMSACCGLIALRVVVVLAFGGTAALSMWLAELRGPEAEMGVGALVLACATSISVLYAIWLTQCWLNRQTITEIIIEDIAARVDCPDLLTTELRRELRSNLSALPSRTLLRAALGFAFSSGTAALSVFFSIRAAWETGNMTLRAFSRRHNGALGPVNAHRQEWCRETASELPAYR